MEEIIDKLVSSIAWFLLACFFSSKKNENSETTSGSVSSFNDFLHHVMYEILKFAFLFYKLNYFFNDIEKNNNKR